MNRKQSITSAFLLSMTRYLTQKGFSVIDICREAGIHPDHLKFPDHRITIDELNRFNDSAVRITGDLSLGLHIGSSFSLGGTGIIGYMMMNCSTIGEAFDKFCRYQELSGDIVKLRIVCGKTESGFRWEYNDKILKHSSLVVEALMTAVLASIRELSGADFPLRSAHFGFAATGNTAEYKKIFNCELSFCEQETSVFFSKKNLLIPVKNPNRELLGIMEQHAVEYLKNYRRDMSLAERVEKIIRIYCGIIPRIEMIADELGMPVRNLQNSLKAEGMTFRQLREKVQLDLACEYLKEDHYSIVEISRMLGFSDSCVFVKFFKRGTGTSPGQYRKNGH